MKNLFYLLSCGLFINACALLGPKYVKPEVSSPTNFRSESMTQTFSESNLALASWWKKFKDPKLNQLMEMALINNNNLQVVLGNIEQAKALLSRVNMAWIPTMGIGGIDFMGQGFNSSFTNNSGNPLLNAVKPNNPQNFNGYAVGFVPTYSLNIFNLIKQDEIAKLNLGLQKEAYNAIRLTVISQVAASYFNLLGFHKELELQETLLQDAQLMKKYALIQYRLGSGTELNLEGLNQFIASTKALIPAIKNNITQSENALQVLTNQNPAQINLTNDLDKINNQNIVPANLPSAVLRMRPDIAISEYQLQIANADIGLARSKFFPTISLTGLLGQGSVALNNLFTASSDFWALSLGAAMPIFNLGIYKEVDQAKALKYSAYFGYIQTVRAAFSQVDNAFSMQDSLNKTYLAQESSLLASQNLYSIALKQYQLGALAYSNTLGFKFNIDYNLKSLNLIKMEQLNSLVNVYQVLGGGYLAESGLTRKQNI